MDKKRLQELAGICESDEQQMSLRLDRDPLIFAIRNAIAQGMNEAGVAIPTTAEGRKAVRTVLNKVWQAVQKYQEGEKHE